MAEIAYLVERIGPYHKARFDSFSANSGWGLHVIEYVARDKTYEWGTVDSGKTWNRETLFDSIVDYATLYKAVKFALERSPPKIVAVPGWSDPGALAAVEWANRRGIPIVLMSDSTAWDSQRRNHAESFKTAVVRLCSSAFVAGSPHREYAMILGMPESRVFVGYDAVDNSHFTSECRTEFSGYLLSVARFVPKKNLRVLLDAYAAYRDSSAMPLDLVLAGDGPLRASLEARADELGVREFVRFPGFVQYEDLPRLYAAAAAFVLPSVTEQWGLVVNEAMAAGLPVLVSNRCGCARDLVGRDNGITFDPEDVAGLARALHVLEDAKLLESMGRVSRKRIENWGLERFVSGLRNAAICAARVGAPRKSLFAQTLLYGLALRRRRKTENPGLGCDPWR